MTSPTPIDRAALKRLCAEATPGPWTFEIGEYSSLNKVRSTTEIVAQVIGDSAICDATTEFIAAANPAAVSALLADLAAKDAEIERLKADNDDLIAGADADAFMLSNANAEIEKLKARIEDELADNISLNNEKMDLKYNQLATANARIADLKVALKPFARAGEMADEYRTHMKQKPLRDDAPALHPFLPTIGDLRRARSALSEAPGGETGADDEEKIGRAVCRQIHLAQWPESNWRPGELDRKVDQYWRHWTPNAILAALSTEALSAPAPPAIKGKE